MRREEKRRKFNEAVVNTLFPPPSPSSPQPKDEDVPPFNVLYPDIKLETRSSSASSGDEDGECGTKKQPTRAQRKRMRKKKLKEDNSHRNKIIGPLLPSTMIGESEKCTQDARRNISQEPRDDRPQDGCSSQKNKVKQRRKAKRQARDTEQH